MAIFSDTQFSEWLRSPTKTVVVAIIASHSRGTAYFSNYGYLTLPTDSIANQYFEDLLLSEINITETINRATVGDILVINDHISNADWLDYNWQGFPFRIYLGDARWRFNNFRLVINAINGGIAAPQTNQYRFLIRDPHEALRIELGSEEAPLSFGNPFNVRPALIDNILLRYKVNDGPIAGLVVRDNGVQLTPGTGYTVDLNEGEFTLLNAPAGQVTCDVTKNVVSAQGIISEIASMLPIGNERSVIWDIADAMRPGSAMLTRLSGTGFATAFNSRAFVVLFSNNEYMSLPLNVLSSTGITNGTQVFIKGKLQIQAEQLATHSVTLRISNRADLTGNYRELAILQGLPSRTIINFSAAFEYDSATVNGFRYFGLHLTESTSLLGAQSYTLFDTELFHQGIGINTSNFALFPNRSTLGLYLDKPTQAEVAIRTIMETVGGGFRFNNLGQLELFRLEPATTADLELFPDDILSISDSGLRHLRNEEPIKKMEIGYERNWNVQSADSIAGSVSAELRERYSTEYKYIERTNSFIADFPLAKDKRIDTLFLEESAAIAELTRRQDIRNDKRDVYLVKSFLAPENASIGESVRITYPDYGFENGVIVRIIGIRQNPERGRIDLTVWK